MHRSEGVPRIENQWPKRAKPEEVNRDVEENEHVYWQRPAGRPRSG